MADFASYLSDQANAGAVIALGATATAVWATRTARSEPAEADDAPAVPKPLGGGAETWAVAAVAVAAIVAALASPRPLGLPFDWLVVLGLVLAATLRGYRLSRPGPAVLDRLAAVLAVVPGCALLAGAMFMAFDGTSGGRVLLWMLGYAVAGALALIVGLRWQRAARA
ncbi:hypothetical protein ACQP2P_12210 [Dactylosporangium sp. CA-139114]|uniref:hypothetical protein n=1 Tax=Dactylosporangium sp. CA-139114 TaxID=3239931 RepID=UPI003D99D0B0